MQASQVAGHPLTLAEILATPDPVPQQLTPLQVLAGTIDFLRIILVLGLLSVVGAVIYLFRCSVSKLLIFFKRVPVAVEASLSVSAGLL